MAPAFFMIFFAYHFGGAERLQAGVWTPFKQVSKHCNSLGNAREKFRPDFDRGEEHGRVLAENLAEECGANFYIGMWSGMEFLLCLFFLLEQHPPPDRSR